jgi:hypothetical protein
MAEVEESSRRRGEPGDRHRARKAEPLRSPHAFF